MRQEAVKALISLYARDNNIGSMQHFTERFKVQLVRMATSEVDLSVRISCIHVLRSIDNHGLLEEDQRDEAAALVFEEEKRVRSGIAGFFAGLLEEQVKERMTELEAENGGKGKGKKAAAEGEDQLRFKCLAELLVKYGKQLDKDDEEDARESDDDDENDGDELTKKADGAVERNHRGRVALAVESLWESVDAVKDWQGLLDFLLLDHSTVAIHGDDDEEDDDEATPRAKNKANRKSNGRKKQSNGGDDVNAVDAKFRLDDEEESLLIEVLVASLSNTTRTTAGNRKVSLPFCSRSPLNIADDHLCRHRNEKGTRAF